MKSILDPTFRYIPAACTDIRKTFARIRAEQPPHKATDASRNNGVSKGKKPRRPRPPIQA